MCKLVNHTLFSVCISHLNIMFFVTRHKNKDLIANADGSLTIYVQADAPPKEQRTNWLYNPTQQEHRIYALVALDVEIN